MLRFLVLLSIVVGGFSAAIPEGLLPQMDGRIVGGTATTIKSFPWQVSIQRGGAHFCGGAIYNETIIVTAAHCVHFADASKLKVRAGSSFWNSGGVLVPVAALKEHQKYNGFTMVNDIALLRLSSPLNYSSTIQSIGLASVAPTNDAVAAVSGWGTTATGSATLPTFLKFANVKIINRTRCASPIYSYVGTIKETMICAAALGKDACQGDSGGPLVSGGLLVGVVSWGNSCADPNYPGVYADVAELHSWITETLAGEI